MTNSIDQLNLIKKSYIDYYKDIIIHEGRIYYKTVMINSVLQRSLSIIDAFEKLLPSNNIMVLNSLIRMQIDNCIYVYGVYLLHEDKKDINKIFNDTIIKNKQLKKFKISGKYLTDFYIVSKIDDINSTFKDAYKFYCRFIHFSDSAGMLAMNPKENYKMEFNLSTDYSRFSDKMVINTETFIKISKLVLNLIKKYWSNIDNGNQIGIV